MFLFKLGSIFKTSSLLRIFNPLTPFSLPFIYKLFIFFISSSSKANTKDPFLLKGTDSSLHNSSNISLPFTLYLAINVPTFGSYPAWTIAELAFVVPIATSFSFSINATFKSYLVNSLKIDAPITPAPIMATSYIKFTSPLFLHTKKAKTKIRI